MKDFLDGCDGEFASCLLLYPVVDLPRNVHSGKGCVISEGEPVGVGGLPVLKPRVLLGIAEYELDLETGVLDEKYLCGCQIKPGAEDDLPYGLAPEYLFQRVIYYD